MNNLTNKNIMVTGATSGIGKALVEQLINLGANVAFCGRSTDKMQTLLTHLAGINTDSEKTTGKTFHQVFDIADFSAISSFVSAAIDTLGSIDILVNCAGANSSRAKVNEINMADLQQMLTINMLAPTVFMQETYNQSMQAQSSGIIINVMSTVCGFSNEGIGAYTASKSGFDALTKVFRKEVRANGIKVCAIYPGGVDTPFRDADRPEYLEPSHVVDSILHLARQSEHCSVDELTVRPLIEKNFC